MDDFAHETGIQVRYRDLDTLSHVNNAVYASYLEQARSEYFEAVADLDIGGGEMVIARLEIDYRAPVEMEDREVSVGTSIVELGGSSLTMDQRIVADGAVAAEATCVIVAIGEDGGARALPESWREAIESFEDGN
ncbi:acyl-CoA thioesterase [Halomarina oriensis]|uniref:Acyl-CoA thioesterase n=1 Tax=Halomarina oriensis TaxID=671145 RepID=A0A6B0GKY9_9EURY|nr:acyl-CoA thioesterase [Halomarina oriensis]